MATGDKIVTLDDLKVAYDDVNGKASELKSAFDSGLVDGTLSGWEKGSFNTTNGTNYPENTRIRNQTKVGFSTGVCRFKLAPGYSTVMFAWDLSGNYVGAYKTDGTWTAVASDWKSVTEFDLSTIPNYVIKFSVTRVPSSSDIAASEGDQVILYKYTDKTLSVENKAADAKVTGDNVRELKSALAHGIYISLPLNGYIRYTDGTYVEASTADQSRTSNYIDVTSYGKIYYNIYLVGNTVGYIIFYDKNKTIIGKYTSATTNQYEESSIDIPDNACFARVCLWNTLQPGQYFILGATGYRNKEEIISRNEIIKTYVPTGDNGYLKKDTGAFVPAYNGGPVSDYIPLLFNKIYYSFRSAGTSIAYICFYRDDKSHINGSSFTTDSGYVSGYVNVPIDAAYFRCGLWYNEPDQLFYSMLNDLEMPSTESTWFLIDSILKPIDFNNKKLYAFGDSITQGVMSPSGSAGDSKYISLFSNHVGATLQNEAISGTTITKVSGSSNSIYDKVTSLTANDVDIIWIAGGINDFVNGKTIGIYDSTDEYTFYGALNKMCSFITENYPTIPVIFVTPVNVTKTWSTSTNALDEYREAIFKVATKYKFNVVDGSTLGLPSQAGEWGNDMIADADGCHPTLLGHYQMFKGLCTKLL